MGTSIGEIDFVLSHLKRSQRKKKILDIGCSNIFLATKEDVYNFIQKYSGAYAHEDLEFFSSVFADGSAYLPHKGGTNGAWLGELLTRAGFGYLAYDVFEGFQTAPFDLNTDTVPRSDAGTFDAVINCGTTEHVLNQFNCMKVIHDATRVGGIMYHAIPMTGLLDHGYFSYNPVLFFDLAKANDYEIVSLDYRGPGGINDVAKLLIDKYADQAPWAHPGQIKERWSGIKISDGLLAIVLRKTAGAPFRAALEVRTAGAGLFDGISADYGGNRTNSAKDEFEIEQARAALKSRIEEAIADYTNPALGWDEIATLFTEYRQIFPPETFPLVLERKALQSALAADSGREDLRCRLDTVEKLMAEKWPIMTFPLESSQGENLVKLDGQEAEILSLTPNKRRYEAGLVAFKKYLEIGRPERFPLALEYYIWKFAAEQDPECWSLRLYLGRTTSALARRLELRRSTGDADLTDRQ